MKHYPDIKEINPNIDFVELVFVSKVVRDFHCIIPIDPTPYNNLSEFVETLNFTTLRNNYIQRSHLYYMVIIKALWNNKNHVVRVIFRNM